MRILLDECMPAKLADSRAFDGHTAEHTTRRGWSGLTNGRLHAAASREYGLFITSDRHFRDRAPLSPTSTMGVVFVRISPNVLEYIQPAVEALAKAVPLDTLVGKLTIVRRDGWEIR